MLLTYRICIGQNLVPNPSFENIISCPYNFNQFNLVASWINPTIGTPDYFNQCTTFPGINVPNNIWGYQPARSGVGYPGIFLYQDGYTNVREFLEVELDSVLQTDSCYRFEMYVNLGNLCIWTCDNIGAYFSDTLITGINNYFPLPYTPQINNLAGTVFDTLNWTLVSGEFLATGGEKFLIIGNYDNDAITNPVITNAGGLQHNCFVYIEDVSIAQIPQCSTGINEPQESKSVSIFPNPMSDKIHINLNKNEYAEILIYNIAAQILLRKSFIHSATLSTEQLSKGIYFYEVRNINGVIGKGKVVKN